MLPAAAAISTSPVLEHAAGASSGTTHCGPWAADGSADVQTHCRHAHFSWMLICRCHQQNANSRIEQCSAHIYARDETPHAHFSYGTHLLPSTARHQQWLLRLNVRVVSAMARCSAADLAALSRDTQVSASAGLRGMSHCALQVSRSSGTTGHMSTLPGSTQSRSSCKQRPPEYVHNDDWSMVSGCAERYCLYTTVVRTMLLSRKTQPLPNLSALSQRVRLQQTNQIIDSADENMSLYRMQAGRAVSAVCTSPLPLPVEQVPSLQPSAGRSCRSPAVDSTARSLSLCWIPCPGSRTNKTCMYMCRTLVPPLADADPPHAMHGIVDVRRHLLSAATSARCAAASTGCMQSFLQPHIGQLDWSCRLIIS